MQSRQQQEWRRRAAPRAAGDNGSASGVATSHLGASSDLLAPSTRPVPPTASHTIASASKIVRKSSTSATDKHAQPRSTPLPPSRWKELRHSVRVKATLDSSERRATDATIADLCDEDREKVAKLIRRIVEIGTLQEETEREFARQRSAFEAEIAELREQVKRDTSELDDLSDTLKATLLKLRDYQERVLVLEDSNDAETRSRLASEQTLDLLKLEVEKLRDLVTRQTHEMQQRERDAESQFTLEREQLEQQLRAAQDELMLERRLRMDDKQRELDARLARSIAGNEATAATSRQSDSGAMDVTPPVEALAPVNPVAPTLSDSQQHPMPTVAEQEPLRTANPPVDVSSFLNTSSELPERIQGVMDEWKQRMQDAIAGSVQSIARDAAASASRVQDRVVADEDEESTQRQPHSNDNDQQQRWRQRRRQRESDHDRDDYHRRSERERNHSRSLRLDAAPRVVRVPFDRHLRIASASECDSDSDSDSDSDVQQHVRTRRQTSRDFGDDDVYHDHDHRYRHPRRSMRNATTKPRAASLSRSERRRYRVSSSDRRAALRLHHRPMTGVAQSTRQHRRAAADSSDRSGDSSEGSNDGSDDNGDACRDDDSDAYSEAVCAARSSPSFVLLTEFAGGRRADADASFGSLYERSLFDVVDALEGASAAAAAEASAVAPAIARSPSPSLSHQRPSNNSSSSSNGRRRDGNAIDASPTSARLQSLLEGMAVREQKLARFAARTERLCVDRSDVDDVLAHDAIADASASAVDADLDLFNAVKDVYATERFAARIPGRSNTFMSTSAADSDDNSSSNWRDSALALASDLACIADSALGPPLSPQDLSVRDAIEQDMAELLLHDDALAHSR